MLGEPALLASNQEYSRKSVAQDFASSPAGDEPTIATPIDFAHIANSLCEHRVSFCENSDPMLARDGGGIVGIRLGVEKEYSGEARRPRRFTDNRIPDYQCVRLNLDLFFAAFWSTPSAFA